MRRVWLFVVLLSSLLVATPARTVVACDGAFHRVAHPVAGSADLTGIDMISLNDVWAVGIQRDDAGVGSTLTEHWNGMQWSAVPSPASTRSATLVLRDVSGIATDDVWAVGTATNRIFVDKTLVTHWDGAEWSVVPSPSPNANGLLNGIVAIAPDDAWAGGTYLPSGGPPKALFLHWNGRRWAVVVAPSTGVETVVSMDANGPRDVWAVGRRDAEGGSFTPMIKHWNGTAWREVAIPIFGPNGGHLNDVVAISSNDVWAVGVRGSRNVALHWNGAAWSFVPTAHPTPVSDFSSVAATASNDVWAVGAYLNTAIERLNPLAEHWNGTAWTVVPSDAGTSDSRLGAVDALGQRRWAVGNAIVADGEVARIQTSCGVVSAP